MKFLYYYQLKNGEIRYAEKEPKKKDYIAEMYKRIDTNETQHSFSSFKANNSISIETKFTSFFCGYDRQVKHDAILKAMFKRLQEIKG